MSMFRGAATDSTPFAERRLWGTTTPSGEEINQKGVSPDEEKFFASDVLGATFIDADLKSATFERLACAAEVGRRARD